MEKRTRQGLQSSRPVCRASIARKPQKIKENFVLEPLSPSPRRNGSLDPRRATSRLITSPPKSCRRPIRGIGAARAVNILSGPNNGLWAAINNKTIRALSTALAPAAIIFQLPPAIGAGESLRAFVSCPGCAAPQPGSRRCEKGAGHRQWWVEHWAGGRV